MVDFDESLAILENKTRREILRFLVKEPHYPLQLSELMVVSQQAIVKHLKVLEGAGFVDSETLKSERGGPPRKLYRVNQSFSIRLDLGPDLFRAEYRSMPKGSPIKLSGRLPAKMDKVVGKIGTRRKIPMSDAMEILSDLDLALEKVDEQRDAIIALHQQVMHKVSPSVEEHSESYEERQLAHALMSHPRRPLDLDSFSQGLRIQSVHAEKMMDTLRNQLMREFAASEGTFVSASEQTPLPWWLAK